MSLTSPRRAVAAGLGGYVGLNVAALCAAIEFGLQPTLFHRADGTPLYAPFHLAQTIPAMALAHLTVAGGVEFALDRGSHRVSAAGEPAAAADQPRRGARSATPRWRRPGGSAGAGRSIGLGVMAVLTPLGLLAPGHAVR